jgi:hypothetical protein
MPILTDSAPSRKTGRAASRFGGKSRRRTGFDGNRRRKVLALGNCRMRASEKTPGAKSTRLAVRSSAALLSGHGLTYFLDDFTRWAELAHSTITGAAR